VETLTGVRWIAHAALDHPQWRFVFGYEESLGYLVGDLVRDKDGITAGLAFAELMARLRAEGRTVWDRWRALAQQHGLHESANTSIRYGSRSEAAEVTGVVLDAARVGGPGSVAGRRLLDVVDYATGPDGLSPTDAVAIEYDGVRVVIRGSGTEPKLKCYVEVVVAPGGGYEHQLAEAKRLLARSGHELRAWLTAVSVPVAVGEGVA
jgi:phosphomannomutase